MKSLWQTDRTSDERVPGAMPVINLQHNEDKEVHKWPGKKTRGNKSRDFTTWTL